ncbi:MAG TPA: tRNA pseudouridine(13) synthase TruD [Candidatus Bathyarchaeia archaeon]|nr:tRNA pseudouridine(13) synthase TruD [Candidatus Bathyarchaeia archaeon]
MAVPRIDKLLGIDVYATETMGIGGVIRQSVDDFVVEEVLVDGSRAKIEKAAESQVLGASLSRQHYLLCVLVKRNWDTFIAIKNIAKQLGISQKQISIAGIKDAKAVTAQHITIEHSSMEDASKINVKDIEVRPVGYFRDKLSPYYLLGNNFDIRIKAINLAEPTIRKRIAATIHELEAVGGVSNFFGHQRFGTTRPITHLVGKAIISGDFEEAVMLFLAKASAHEHPSSRQARRELQSKQDFKQALQNFPKQLRYERLMLSHLAEKPEDLVGAFKRLPIRLQELFVQAYQSYLFNRFLSERIRSGFSLNTAEVGDYVVNVERSGLPMIKTGKIAGADALAEANESIKAGRMRIAMPLVGIKQRLSQGAMGQIEKQILEAEDVKTENFRIDAIPEISGRGELRTVTVPIKNFKLGGILASADNLKERQAELEFMLLRGSYATVLLREIMKPRNPISAGF